jgi:hypothetical protein
VLKIEADLAQVIHERLDRAGHASAIDNDYLADILARTTLALIRSALIRDWQLRSDGTYKRPAATTLINQAFSTLQIPLAASPTRQAPAHTTG